MDVRGPGQAAHLEHGRLAGRLAVGEQRLHASADHVPDQGVDRGVGWQLGRHRAALLQHRHPVAQLPHLAEPVGDPDDPDPLGGEPPDHLEQRFHLDVVQDRRRLVEDQQLDRVRQRPGHRDDLLLGRPERRHRRRRSDALIPEPGQQRRGLAVHRRPVQQRTPAPLVAEEHVQRHRQVRDQVQLLVDGGDAAGDRGSGVADRERLALEPDLAGGGLDQPGDALDERRLAGAVLADQTVHLAAGHGQVDAIEGAHARVVLDQPADLEQRTVGFTHLPPPGLRSLLDVRPPAAAAGCDGRCPARS